MKLLILIMAGICILYHHIKTGREYKRWSEAFDLHCDMYDKYRELLENPLTTYLKWKEWLPIFEEADERCKRLAPETANLGRISDFVKRVISDDGYQKDVQAVR